MPRVPAALRFGLLVAGIVLAVPVPVRGAMATNDQVAAAAEGHGLRCAGVENTGDGGSHLACDREAADQTATNIDLSVTYNVISAADAFAFATVAAYTTPPPADWLDVATSVALLFCEAQPDVVRQAVESTAPQTDLNGCRIKPALDDFPRSIDISTARSSAQPPGAPATWSADGASTYSGSWTLTAYENDADFDDPAFPVGASLPGTITVDCSTSVDHCGFTATREGELWSARALEATAEGSLRSVEEESLDNCGAGQIMRTTHLVTFGPDDATASIARVYLPRTCTYESSTLYAEDSTWSFAGNLTEYVPPTAPADDLAGFLAAYGLNCAEASAATICTLEVTDDQGLDATYRVTIRTDEAGRVIGLDAVVISLDESMPSDAIGFLREVAARASVADGDGLVAWFDGAIAGAAAPYEAGGWTATWADVAEGAGRTLNLAIAQAGSSTPPSAAPSTSAVPAAPGVPTDPADAPNAGSRPFASSIPEPAEVSTDPIVLLQSAALAALLVFLMPFPSQLFNSTLEAHEGEVRRWLRIDRIGSAVAGIGEFWGSAPGVIVFTLLAALLYGFLDPGFGLDAASLATFTGMLLGIVLVTAAFAVPTVLAHRRIGDQWSLKVVPISLLIGVACVVLSRLTGFQPGYLYGLLIGLAFARELSAADEGRATALGAAIMLIVAFGAWLALGGLPDGEGFGLAVARTSLAALMVAGLEGVVFGLLPMRFLPGEPLYAWNRILWGGLLLIGAFAFFHILINPASGYLSDTSRTPLFTVVGLLLGFSLVSVAFWGWFRFRASAPAEG